MDEDKLNRLPPDVKKQFLKLAFKLSENKRVSKNIIKKFYKKFLWMKID